MALRGKGKKARAPRQRGAQENAQKNGKATGAIAAPANPKSKGAIGSASEPPPIHPNPKSGSAMGSERESFPNPANPKGGLAMGSASGQSRIPAYPKSKSALPSPSSGKLERGVCIVCGNEGMGVPAKPDALIFIARKTRALFRFAPKHTMACMQHFPEAQAKGEAFSKRLMQYRLYGALFFLLLLFGQAAFGQFRLGIALPAAAGGLFIALLPYFGYYPRFPIFTSEKAR